MKSKRRSAKKVKPTRTSPSGRRVQMAGGSHSTNKPSTLSRIESMIKSGITKFFSPGKKGTTTTAGTHGSDARPLEYHGDKYIIHIFKNQSKTKKRHPTITIKNNTQYHLGVIDHNRCLWVPRKLNIYKSRENIFALYTRGNLKVGQAVLEF